MARVGERSTARADSRTYGDRDGSGARVAHSGGDGGARGTSGEHGAARIACGGHDAAPNGQGARSVH
ncbi:hypothetical protein J2Z21_003565 [Streptomyces griseochromogenes]|uniref:Uncharacterized protein n=1 Tax=Streptomyces griseochromogenes TaxID=68214 RepID=A0A1B1B817_9ACTN|nr:hypothetical protein AVL59_40145 [Streptomyces griseochromogenes]MBP2050626.1 hypothetical protein [Streptomyces griseochromogenes]